MTVTVAIVGRPNVGKSTLFNRLVGRRIALVDDTPGVTRDRREAEGRIGDLKFKVLDTAGYEDRTDGSLEDRMRQQTEIAIRDADVILFMIDARAGVTPLDQRFAQVLRKAGKDVHLIGNKAEGREADPGLMEAYSLGFGEPVSLSAEHGLGLADLHAIVSKAVDEAAAKAASAARTGSPDARGRCRPSAGRWHDRGGAGQALGPAASPQRRHHRAAQCGQIDADQPHGRRGTAADRARGGYHPRLDHGAVGVQRPDHQPGRHRRHAAQVARSMPSSKSSR